MTNFEVVVSAGTLRSTAAEAVHFPHRWTSEGVSVEAEFTGAHLLHLAAAGCVLNDVYREAQRVDLPVEGVRVRAWGGFDTATWTSSGICYDVRVDSCADEESLLDLLTTVEAVAEIPRAIRAGASVDHVSLEY